MKRILSTVFSLGAAVFLFFTGCRLPGEGHTYLAPESNLIFISIDTLRADHLGIYGYERETSPNIDSFAADNLTFMNHFVSITTTLPSHTSMFTGLHPKAHGIVKNGLELSEHLRTLPEILKDNGYRTAAFVSSYPMHSYTNIDQGFDLYSDEEVRERKDADFLVERSLPWIEENRDEKFFLFLHLWDPHSPYRPPEEYRLWGDDKIARYDGEIRYVDDAVGRIFDRLKELDLFEDSIIILTSDHGESLGDHNYWGHPRSLYEECLRAPLVIHFPGKLGIPPGKVEHLTSGVDFLPTILGSLGIEEALHVEGMNIFGDAIREREYIFAQRKYYRGPASEEKGETPKKLYVARSLEWKYFYRTRGRDSLYRLTEDPGELRDLMKTGSAEQYKPESYVDLIQQWLKDTELTFDADLEITEEVKERLRALGYAQ